MLNRHTALGFIVGLLTAFIACQLAAEAKAATLPDCPGASTLVLQQTPVVGLYQTPPPGARQVALTYRASFFGQAQPGPRTWVRRNRRTRQLGLSPYEGGYSWRRGPARFAGAYVEALVDEYDDSGQVTARVASFTYTRAQRRRVAQLVGDRLPATFTVRLLAGVPPSRFQPTYCVRTIGLVVR